MRIKRLFYITILFLAAIGLTSCYKAKYEVQSCAIYNQNVQFVSKYEAKTYTAYFDFTIKYKTIDEWIERFNEYAALLSEKEIDNIVSYFVGSEVVVNYYANQDVGTAVSLPSNIAKDEAFAWVLKEKLGNKLPYGVYAGLASYWIGDKYSLLNKEQILNSGYLSELQFPLYETDNLPTGERKLAWNISYTIVNDWVKEGNRPEEIAELTTEQLNSYIQSTYGISLPNYEFSPYSTKYEYKVDQGCFTYYINKEYQDLILPKKHFTAKYDKLSDWLKDNWNVKLLTDQIFDVSSMPHIEIYMDNGLDAISHGFGGYASKTGSKRKIDLWAAGVFYHEYNHHVHALKGIFEGNFTEELPEINCNDSKYGRITNYYLYSNDSHFPYQEYLLNGELIDEKKMNSEAMELYKKRAPSNAIEDNFDYWLYVDCFSALRKDSKNFGRCQSHSLFNYILNTYGFDYILSLNKDIESDIKGKKLAQIKEEWRFEYLPQFLK